jgi:putative intracellular protease/amidase
MDIVIPIFPEFTALDAVGPYQVLRGLPDAKVVFAAAERGLVRTDDTFMAVHADAALSEIDAADVLVMPGGWGTRAAMTDEALLDCAQCVVASRSVSSPAAPRTREPVQTEVV